MADEDLEQLLAEQIAYYRARASEYDATSPLPADARAWRALVAALEAFAPRGRVLELACGTGLWTAVLAEHATELTAVDSSPEMLALATARVPGGRVRFVRADLFGWRPGAHYDVVFFSAWLSHVPPQRFERFWALVGDCLAPGGRIFLVDELPAAAAGEEVVPGTGTGTGVPVVSRRLTGGERHRAVKVFHEPAELERRMRALGWELSAHSVGPRFFYASGAPVPA